MTLREIEPSDGGGTIVGVVIKVVAGKAYVEHQPAAPRATPWVIPLDLETGLPPAGSDWAWKAEPTELAYAVWGEA